MGSATNSGQQRLYYSYRTYASRKDTSTMFRQAFEMYIARICWVLFVLLNVLGEVCVCPRVSACVSVILERFIRYNTDSTGYTT